jgi:methionyl-tRNA formyltransferase
MKIIFFGSPPFSAYILEQLHINFNVVAVVCPPDNEKGRGRKINAPAVKQKAEELKIEVLQPENLKAESFVTALKSLNADLFIVVAFRMLPEIVWKMPKFGCVNLHTSLLPNYKGAAPINWVLINGEKQTGITTFFINDKIDEGNIILQEKIELDGKITAASLYNIMMKNGTNLLLETIDSLKNNSIKEIVQKAKSSDEIAPKLKKELLRINWNKSSTEIHNLIRGLSPWLEDNAILKDVAICPSAWFYLLGENEKQLRVKLLLSNLEKIEHLSEISSIVTDNKTHLKIVVKDGFISILKLQMEGKKAMDIKSFLAGFQMENSFTVC